MKFKKANILKRIIYKNKILFNFSKIINLIIYILLKPLFRVSKFIQLKYAKTSLMREWDFNKKEDNFFTQEINFYSWMYEPGNGHFAISPSLARSNLNQNSKVLDIGCGWGSLAIDIAKSAKCEVTGITLSENQLNYCNQKAKEMNLQNQVKFKLMDYRELKEKFDRIVSVGMFEHVGRKFYKKFFNQIEKLLNDFFNGFEFLYNHDDTTKKIGAVGFCYGGGVCNALAVAYPELSASVPFYGSQAKSEDVPRIKSPLLLHFAELDERINKGWPEYEGALKNNNEKTIILGMNLKELFQIFYE